MYDRVEFIGGPLDGSAIDVNTKRKVVHTQHREFGFAVIGGSQLANPKHLGIYRRDPTSNQFIWEGED